MTRLVVVGGCIGACLLLVGVLVFVSNRKPTPPVSGQPTLAQTSLRVAKDTLRVELADDPDKRAYGLSGRSGLSPETGMLFLFPGADHYGFWMKDMRFSLDIIYIRDHHIREIFADVPPPVAGEVPVTVTPQEPADQVLEVVAGEAKRRGWQVGSEVILDESSLKISRLP